ncbi:uncharacterized protein EV422DRAFT_26203 [Fimicolochytrium jonesii]|uniref:uncharacterized protein n=1 Tax=Fimicolochytrium jonesii TaxID=1396493 RepID=UPI0022FF1CB9|nr:uncharacterized protein EV422DRAFT_26203 [Fimicolochytrium jonesii]KAI8827108.1 hypothetical protein EV422DRAFT_26203 [Fimicolochytrium jonesii]
MPLRAPAFFRRRRATTAAAPVTVADMHRKKGLACRPMPILLTLLSIGALALGIISFRTADSWYRQDVGINVAPAAGGNAGVGFPNQMALKVDLNSWCVDGLPASVRVPQIDQSAPGTCKPIDMCSIIGDSCWLTQAGKPVLIVFMAATAASIILAMMLLCNIPVLTLINYILLLATSIAAIACGVAILVYFSKLTTIVPPRIPDIVRTIAGPASGVVSGYDAGHSYMPPRLWLIIATALMSAVFLLTLINACIERCGRRVTSHHLRKAGRHEVVQV